MRMRAAVVALAATGLLTSATWERRVATEQRASGGVSVTVLPKDVRNQDPIATPAAVLTRANVR